MLSVVNADGSIASGSLIDEIVREGPRRMLAAALEAEVNQYIAELAAETDEHGRRLVVRNGHHRPRTVRPPVVICSQTSVFGPNTHSKRRRCSSGHSPPTTLNAPCATATVSASSGTLVWSWAVPPAPFSGVGRPGRKRRPLAQLHRRRDPREGGFTRHRTEPEAHRRIDGRHRTEVMALEDRRDRADRP